MPEIEIDATDRVLNPDRYLGLDGFRRLVREMGEVWDSWHIEAPEMVERDQALAAAGLPS